MITQSMKKAMMIAGFALVAIIAVAGWTRNPNAASTPNYFNNPNALNTNNAPQYGVNNQAQQPQYDASGRPVYGQPQQGVYAQPVGYGAPNYAAQNCAEPLGVHTAAYAPASYGVPAYGYSAAPVTRYRTYSRPRVVRVVQDRDYVVRRKRSTGKSVAIVAGSAGAGAALGALIGGGKGAGIGALSGGAAGFVYDRLTHNR